LRRTCLKPEQIYPTQTIYQQLAQKNIQSTVFQHETIAFSPYSQTLCAGSKQIAFDSFAGGLKNLADLAKKKSNKQNYFFMYFGDIDSAGHRRGIDSNEFANASQLCWQALEEVFWKEMQGSDQRTAIVLAADHGMVAVNPKTTLYLNREIPDIDRYFKKNRQGEPLVPAGSCRDFFLHIQDTELDRVHQLLSSRFKKQAEVFKTTDLIKQGFFGSKRPSKLFLNRVGNLVILPYENEAIWWFHKNRFEQHFFAAHGGLTRSEMETIFLFQEI
jgi:hypothetical protein